MLIRLYRNGNGRTANISELVSGPPLWLELRDLDASRVTWHIDTSLIAVDPIADHLTAVRARILAASGWRLNTIIELPPAMRALSAAKFTGVDNASGPVIGSANARVLFVGERTSGWQHWHGKPRMPFVGAGMSSLCLTRLIRAGGLDESEVAFANSSTENGTPLVLDDLPLQYLDGIVALGTIAARAMRLDAAVKRGRLKLMDFYHPSWINRFQSKRINFWGNMLRIGVDSLLLSG